MNKEKFTIVVTDSGLGGLSVAADLYSKLKKESPYPEVEIVYFNALSDYTLGYNDMKSTEQKATVFNNALSSMYELYNPDLILIACNTLSVIFDETDFAKKSLAPVTGIVETSVKLMTNFLNQHPEAKVAIFGTKTTIGSNLYPSLLIKNGIPAERIISEAGSTIHLEIEKDPKSSATEDLIKRHAENVIKKVGESSQPIGVSLNCTHYGYAEPFFKKAFVENGANLKTMINPNSFMTESLFKKGPKFENPRLSIKVVSQVDIDDATISSMSKLLAPVSPEVAEALGNYQHNPNLFKWKNC